MKVSCVTFQNYFEISPLKCTLSTRPCHLGKLTHIKNEILLVIFFSISILRLVKIALEMCRFTWMAMTDSNVSTLFPKYWGEILFNDLCSFGGGFFLLPKAFCIVKKLRSNQGGFMEAPFRMKITETDGRIWPLNHFAKPVG